MLNRKTSHTTTSEANPPMNGDRITRFHKFALCLILAESVFCSGCQQNEEAFKSIKITGSTMGTFYEVTIADDLSPDQIPKLTNRINELLKQINAEMSTYDPQSEISQFNQSQSLDWFPVSPGFAQVVDEAIIFSVITNGAFDPTVGPLVDLWHFGPEIKDRTIPTQEQIDEVMSSVGCQHLEVRYEPAAIRKSIPNLRLDLSAIAKGYAVDMIAEELKTQGIQGCLVNIGGEVVTVGRKEDGTKWRLGIEKPIEGKRDIERIVHLSDVAMATSGDYRNYYEVDGVRYSHTIDPITGRPVTHHLRSVSVLSDSCLTADVYATALMVMGMVKAKNFAANHNLAVGLLEREETQADNYFSPEFLNQTKE
ncbi:FAD:protein FMN transferase [uncultured Rubinisphaera sp.]|uniref:FAD:protein FMN transferase n=1 Tax=uncultured Rubinisphaera sp. TaxID=1678686 RepID=UPI0030D86415